jgi:hypothetical protein
MSIHPLDQRRAARATTTVMLRATLIWLTVAVIAAACYIYASAIRWTVVGPLVACALLAGGFVMYLRQVEGSMPYFEIGAFYTALVFLYCAFPLLLYVFNGYSYPDDADPRLVLMQHRPDAIGTLGWWYVIYLASFCVGYAIVRGRRRMPSPLSVRPPDAPIIVAIFAALAATWIFFAILGRFFNLSFGSYLEEYLVMQRLPHVVRQFAAHLRVMQISLQMMLVIALCCARRRRYTVILILFLLFTIASNVIWPTARIALFSVLVSAFAAYHLAVRRIPFRWVVIGASAAFVGLLALGPLRAAGPHSLSELKSQMAVQTEFTVMFGNAVDLKYRQNASGGFLEKPNLYWCGILAMIPQQLVPWEKDTAAEWYVREYYRPYYDSGGGLAFGVLAEAVMGFGLGELLWRGLLVGALLGWLHRRTLRPQASLTLVMFYIWMIVWSYQTIRGGTFAPLMFMVYHFFLPLLGILLVGTVLRRSRRAARALATPAPTAGTV